MKNLYILLTFSALCFTNIIFAQATANFTASVTIIQPIGITTTSDMNFANVDAKNGGTITLTPNSTRTSTGDLELAEGGSISAASFEVTGEPGLTYAVTVPNNDYVLSNGSESIIINNFTTDFNSDNALATGSQTINVGASLEVNPNQTPGNYVSQGGLNVTVNYN
ncbi:MAG TPA: DUF4402 domain-containing protein [Gillisia sp.]|nr:DUF4402 domain-containing protein [Gillisia sp.]